MQKKEEKKGFADIQTNKPVLGSDMWVSERQHAWLQLCGFAKAGKHNCYTISVIYLILCLNQYLNMESWKNQTIRN